MYISSLEGYDISMRQTGNSCLVELTNQNKSTRTEFRSRSVPDFHFHGVHLVLVDMAFPWPFQTHTAHVTKVDPNPRHNGWEW